MALPALPADLIRIRDKLDKAAIRLGIQFPLAVDDKVRAQAVVNKAIEDGAKKGKIAQLSGSNNFSTWLNNNLNSDSVTKNIVDIINGAPARCKAHAIQAAADLLAFINAFAAHAANPPELAAVQGIVAGIQPRVAQL